MKNKVYLCSKTGTYILYYGDQKIDLGDYLEIKFTGDYHCEDIMICDSPVVIATYEIEVHFSAIHNESNILETTFVSCSRFVNRFLTLQIETFDKIIPMSVTLVTGGTFDWWWPKINGKSINKHLLRY